MNRILLLALVAVAVCVQGNDDSSLLEKQNCDTVFCALGKECVMHGGEPECECIERCNNPDSPVCGSDGDNLTTYRSECHLYKTACEAENTTITLVATVSCELVENEDLEISKNIEKDEQKQKPVVCMEKDRDGVRLAIIKWISSKLEVDIIDVSYKGLLMKYFHSLDNDTDGALDTMEFMKLLDEDVSITEILKQDVYENPILRGLCSTELIAITDINSDYKLEFEEFHKCLDPAFDPPKSKCELGGTKYKDGEDIQAECDNTCKCACGHWVCTHLPCDYSNRAQDRLEQASNF